MPITESLVQAFTAIGVISTIGVVLAIVYLVVFDETDGDDDYRDVITSDRAEYGECDGRETLLCPRCQYTEYYVSGPPNRWLRCPNCGLHAPIEDGVEIHPQR
jgi:uncharacterized protein YbaR (Trm112 family)